MVYRKKYGRARMYGRRRYKRRYATRRSGKFRRVGFANRYTGSYGVKKGEWKFHQTNHAARTVASGAEVFPQTALIIAQGISGQERIGRRITIVAIELRMTIVQLSSANPDGADNEYRFGVFLDKQCNGATATYGDIFNDVHVDAPRNLANGGRFVVLKDWRFCLSSNGIGRTTDSSDVVTNATTSKCRSLKFYKKCNIVIQYNAASGALTGINSNNIGMYSKRHLVDPAAIWDLHFRVRYLDQ